MATDWAADVRKYVANPDEAAINGIVRYCGISLTKRDSALVAYTDKAELLTVRNSFLKKKLGLKLSDAELDAGIAAVGVTLKGVRAKRRPTVYYLLAEHFGKLGDFVKVGAPAGKAAAKTTTAKAAAPKTPKTAADAKAAPVKAAAPKKTGAKAAGLAAVAGAAGAAAAGAKAAGSAATTATGAASKAAAATVGTAKAAASATTGAVADTAKTAAAATGAVAAGAIGLAGAAAASVSGAASAAGGAVSGAAGAVTGAAGAAAGAVGGAVSGAASAATDAVGNVVGGAADAAGKVGTAAVGAAGAAAGAAGAAVLGAAGLASGAVGKLGSVASGGMDQLTGHGDGDGRKGLGWLWWLLGLALLAFLVWWFFMRGPDNDAAPAPAASASAEASDAAAAGAGDAAAANAAAAAALAAAGKEGSVAIPAGEGVTTEMRDGKPVVKVYFASGKTAVAPAFAATAAALKGWLGSHQGTSLNISGFNDATGNAAANAELSKHRAQAVQGALIAAGVSEAQAVLVKPADSTDKVDSKVGARRVEVVVK